MKSITAFTTGVLLSVAAFFGMVNYSPDYDGPARWETSRVTIAEELMPYAQAWGSTMMLIPVDNAEAQISFRKGYLTDLTGGEATKTFTNGNHIASCSIVVESALSENSGVMTHEIGHCLGMTHEHHGAGTNMHWVAGDKDGGWSDTVTDWDRANLENLYHN